MTKVVQCLSMRSVFVAVAWHMSVGNTSVVCLFAMKPSDPMWLTVDEYIETIREKTGVNIEKRRVSYCRTKFVRMVFRIQRTISRWISGMLKRMGGWPRVLWLV